MDHGMRTLCLFFAVMQQSNKYAVSPLLAEVSQAHKHMTVPILKDKLHCRADFQVYLREPRAVLWLLSLSWPQQALAAALTSTSSPLDFSLNHFTTQVRPIWSPDCTTPYTPGSWEL